MARHPPAFQFASEASPVIRDWRSGQPVMGPMFSGICRVYFTSGPAWDFETHVGNDGRTWKAIGRSEDWPHAL